MVLVKYCGSLAESAGWVESGKASWGRQNLSLSSEESSYSKDLGALRLWNELCHSRPFRCQSSWTGQWMKQCRLSAFPRQASTQWRACPEGTRLAFRAGTSAAFGVLFLPPGHTCSADSKLIRWTVDLADAFPFSPFLKVLSPYSFSFKIYVICPRHLFLFHVLAKIFF